MRRRVRNAAKRGSFHLHRLATRFGVHVLPVHHYSAVPDLLELEATREVWAKPSELPGIRVDLDAQARRLRDVCLPFQAEYRGNAVYRHAVAELFGPGYGYIEAQALHGVVRHFKPRRVIEVGGGVSTRCTVDAVRRNQADGAGLASITCVEPYPSPQLRELAGVDLMAKRAQEVPLDVFAALGEDDLLFIDSSHTVRPGGDVNYLVLEVLPRLAPGVVVQVHDIFLPYDFSRAVLKTYFHWSETSLVRAYLTHNPHTDILFCLSQLFYERRDVLAEVFPEFDPAPAGNGLDDDSVGPFERSPGHFPSSLYFVTR